MARRLVGVWTFSVAMALLAMGCVVQVSFEPFGEDFALVGDWTVNGQPASAETCGQAETVRVVFYNGGSPYFFDELEFPCDRGGFDTGQIFSYGDYTIEWQILDDRGEILDRSGRMNLFVNAPETVVEIPVGGPFDFTVPEASFNPSGSDDSLSANWTINGMEPTADLCDTAGIETVEVILYAQDDASYADGYVVGSAGCAEGEWASVGPVIRDGVYLTEIAAVDGDGVEVASHRSEFELDTTAVTHANLMTADFEVVLVTSLTVTLGWDTNPAAGVLDEGSCDEAGVVSFSYMLTDVATDTNYDQMFDVGCGSSVVWDDIPAGEYRLFVEGEDAGGIKAWNTTCTGLVVEDGMAEVYACAIEDSTGG